MRSPHVEYECHLTVAGDADFCGLEAVANGLGAKVTHILLLGGHHPSQPMLTWQERGELKGVEARAADASRRLAAAGFRVVRLKVEVPPWAECVPQADLDTPQRGERYFEHHVKLLLGPGEVDGLAAIAATEGAHLSRNARRTRPDGRQERFVTQRHYHVGAATADRRSSALRQRLEAGGYRVLEAESEYVLLDSNISLDAGWLEPPRAE